MGRSQRHKVLTQGIAANEELYAEGVGFIPPATTYGNQGKTPVGAGARSVDPEAQKLPLTYGSPGGPLQGSAVQSAYSEGGTQPTDPILDPDGPPPEPPIYETPTITTMTPLNADVGSPDAEITVTGTNFVAESVIMWGTSALQTTIVDATSATALAPISAAAVGQTAVTVVSGEQQSNPVYFTIDEVTP